MFLKKTALSFSLLLSLLASLHLWTGCAGKNVDENDPKSLYNDAEDDVKSHRYAMALEKLRTVKNKFPYSNVAKQASLRIADVHFENEEYIEAASAYETFRDLYPKYEKADYVIFRIGESYFNQLPSTIDRDQTPATKAIESYRELRQLYPKSEYVGVSQEREKDALNHLASKEKYVADFYYKRDMYDSAAARYQKIATKYPGTEVEEESYAQWERSLLAQNDHDGAKHVYDTYLAQHPNGKYAKKMKRALEKSSAAVSSADEQKEESQTE